MRVICEFEMLDEGIMSVIEPMEDICVRGQSEGICVKCNMRV